MPSNTHVLQSHMKLKTVLTALGVVDALAQRIAIALEIVDFKSADPLLKIDIKFLDSSCKISTYLLPSPMVLSVRHSMMSELTLVCMILYPLFWQVSPAFS